MNRGDEVRGSSLHLVNWISGLRRDFREEKTLVDNQYGEPWISFLLGPDKRILGIFHKDPLKYTEGFSRKLRDRVVSCVNFCVGLSAETLESSLKAKEGFEALNAGQSLSLEEIRLSLNSKELEVPTEGLTFKVCCGAFLEFRANSDQGCIPSLRPTGIIAGCDDSFEIPIKFCPWCGQKIKDEGEI